MPLLLTPDVEPLWIARYDYEPGWQLPAHAHDDYFQLILLLSGTGEATVGSRRIPFQSGQMLFLRPGLRHGLQAGPVDPMRTLDTKFVLHNAALRSACAQLGAFHARADERIVALLETIHAEARRQAAYSNALCQTLFAQLLLLLLQKDAPAVFSPLPASAVGAADADLTERMERFLRKNCGGTLNQKTLSDGLHYSYRHLHNVWREAHHESPLQSLWRYRVARAMQLIRYSEYELKRVAELSGFATVHHFTRVFTRLAGASPARWRERERAGIRADVAIRPGFINRPLTIQTAAETRSEISTRIASANSRSTAKRAR
jgi:AraC family L-rhamnose operon transcriptional activator RhaR